MSGEPKQEDYWSASRVTATWKKSMQSNLPKPLSQVCIIKNFFRESIWYLPAVSAERK